MISTDLIESSSEPLKMQKSEMEKKEVERELTQLWEVTLRMEYELEAVLKNN